MKLYSPEHREQYISYYRMHEPRLRCSLWEDRVNALALEVGAQDILDYGCGDSCSLSRYFKRLPVFDYDPGVPGLERLPAPADLVVSLHMLEHVEADFVSAVISHMLVLTKKALLIAVSCEQSTKVLPNGTPWHTFVQPADWWRARLAGFTEMPPRHDRPGAEYVAVWRNT